MKNTLLKILALFVLVTTANAQDILQYKLVVNDTFNVTQKATQDIIQDMNGQKHEMKNELEADFTFIVKEVNDNSYSIDFTFDRFKMVTTSNLYGEIMNVDTSEEASEDDMEAKIFSGLLNSKLLMVMQKDGKIVSIEGTDRLVQKMIDGTGIEDDFTKELMRESMKKEFGNESLSSSFEQMTYIYPLNKVNIGDTWKNAYSGDLKAQNIWKLDTMDESSIVLSGESDVKMETEEDATTMNLTGTQQTSIIANPKNGFVQIMKVNSEAKGTTIMKQMNNIEVPTTIISVIEYKIQ